MAERGRGLNADAASIHCRFEFRLGAQPFDQRDGGLAVDGAGAVGEDPLLIEGSVAVLKGDHIAAVADLARGDLDIAAGCLQGAAAGEVNLGIASEDGQNGRVAAGGQISGHVHDGAELRFDCDRINKGLFHSLQRSAVSQGGNGIVRHAVADQKNIFHRSPFFQFHFGCAILRRT